MTIQSLNTSDLFSTESEIRSAYTEMMAVGRKLDHMIWIAAVSAVALAQKNGNLTIVSDLVTSMPNGSRVQTLMDWISDSAPIAFDEDTRRASAAKGQIDTKKTERMYRSDRSNWDMASLMDVPWYVFAKTDAAPKAKIFNQQKMLDTFDKWIESKDSKGTEYSEEVSDLARDLKEALEAMIVNQEIRDQEDQLMADLTEEAQLMGDLTEEAQLMADLTAELKVA